MKAMRKVMDAIWFGSTGESLLIGAFLLNIFLSLFSLCNRSTLRKPASERPQIGLSTLIFMLNLVNIIGTLAAGKMAPGNHHLMGLHLYTLIRPAAAVTSLLVFRLLANATTKQATPIQWRFAKPTHKNRFRQTTSRRATPR